MARTARAVSERMATKVGEVEALFRYPIKSMRAERLEEATLGWHGLEGDRRLALQRIRDQGGFPWLTASKLPELLLHAPLRREPAGDDGLPTHVRTPAGEELAVFGPELAEAIGARYGAPVQVVHIGRGIFDEASVSLIATTTVEEIGRLAGGRPDVRRFRPNIQLACPGAAPFGETGWVGGLLTFGTAPDAATIAVTNDDERCVMVNLDPDSAVPAPAVLKAIARAADTKAGVYGTVIRRGPLAVGQAVYFEPAGK